MRSRVIAMSVLVAALATVPGVADTLLGGTTVGGSVTGMNGFLARCINETTGDSVSISPGGAASWDCSAAGLPASPGDSILQFVAGPVNCAGCEISGLVTGVEAQFAVCRSLTTGQLVGIPLGGGTSWNCTTSGFVAAGGDVVVQIARGTVPVPPVTYTDDVQPILGVKCADCHTGAGSGGHNIGTEYLDAFLPANNPACAGLNVGECSLVRIQNGSMPRGAGCTGDPVQDAGNPACLTQAEQDTVQAWIDQGLPE